MQISQWATLYVDKHTITGKTYLNNTLVGKKSFGYRDHVSLKYVTSDVSVCNCWS